MKKRSTDALLAGWAVRDITPDRPASLRGQMHVRISTHARTPLTVTALALEGPGADGRLHQALFLSCDRAAAEEELVAGVREVLRDKLPEFDPSMLIMTGTHTHSAPVANEGMYPPQGPEILTPTEYMSFSVARAADAAVEAWQNRKPAAVTSAYGHAVVAHNRRAVYFDGSAKMYGRTNDENFDCIEGYTDHSVDMLFLWDDARKLTGVVVNVPCPSQTEESSTYISADYWHETREELKRRLGSDIFVLAQCGAGGDQSPHPLLYGDIENHMRERKGITEQQDIAARIGDAVEDAFHTAQEHAGPGLPFMHFVRTLKLPFHKVTKRDADWARKELKTVQSRKDWWAENLQGVVERYKVQGKKMLCEPCELHVLRVGGVALATNPYELYLDYGLRVKARSKAGQTIVVNLAGPGGYLPTEKAVKGGSYSGSAASFLVAPEGGHMLVCHTLEMIDGLWKDTQ